MCHKQNVHLGTDFLNPFTMRLANWIQTVPFLLKLLKIQNHNRKIKQHHDLFIYFYFLSIKWNCFSGSRSKLHRSHIRYYHLSWKWDWDNKPPLVYCFTNEWCQTTIIGGISIFHYTHIPNHSSIQPQQGITKSSTRNCN